MKLRVIAVAGGSQLHSYIHNHSIRASYIGLGILKKQLAMENKIAVFASWPIFLYKFYILIFICTNNRGILSGFNLKAK